MEEGGGVFLVIGDGFPGPEFTGISAGGVGVVSGGGFADRLASSQEIPQ